MTKLASATVISVVLLSCIAFLLWPKDSDEWLIYSNPTVGIEFRYPSDAILRSVNEGGLPVEIDESSRVIEVVDGRTGGVLVAFSRFEGQSEDAVRSQFAFPKQQRVVRTTAAGMPAFSTQMDDGDGHHVRWYYVQLTANELLEISETQNDRRAAAILRSLTLSPDVL